jgi:succinoglycan biosynthesis protein ExoO
MQPEVSILIPLYNSAATIERAIKSAQLQTLRDIEILVADDASTDDGAARVAALAREDNRIRLLRLPENGGKPRAMNIMVAQAHGEWLAVLDADDAYHPERLEILLRGAAAVGTDMAADNLNYIDEGAAAQPGEFGRFVRHGFDPAVGNRVLGKRDMLRNGDSAASFDYGILKPVIRRGFVARHRLAYGETSRLAEDFAYLLEYFVAGGSMFLCARALYDWTMPFGTISRRWTATGAGAWRYDYRPTIAANRQLIARMAACGEHEVVALLQRRGRGYQVMVHYIGAQRLAASGRYLAAAARIMRHPGTYRLLAARIAGRIARALGLPVAWHGAG